MDCYAGIELAYCQPVHFATTSWFIEFEKLHHLYTQLRADPRQVDRIFLGDANTCPTEGDRVLIQLRGRDPFLSKPLRHDGWTTLQNGNIMHNDLIGMQTRGLRPSASKFPTRVCLGLWTLPDASGLLMVDMTPGWYADSTITCRYGKEY